MSFSMLLFIAGGWLAAALGLSLVMGRRGHDAFSWFLLGILFGPVAVIFAVEARFEARSRPQVVSGRQFHGTGPVDVLVGFDGSPEGGAAVAVASDLLGARLGRVTLATVVPYDGGLEHERAAQAALERQGATVGRPPRLEILRGRPSQALMGRAVEDGYGLLVIGTRGAGATKALLGSTAVDVARSAPIPVLLVGAGGSAPGPAASDHQPLDLQHSP